MPRPVRNVRSQGTDRRLVRESSESEVSLRVRSRKSHDFRYRENQAGCGIGPEETLNSRKQCLDALGLDEFAGLIQVVVDDRVRIDAHGVIDRRQNLRRVDGVFQRRGTGLV